MRVRCSMTEHFSTAQVEYTIILTPWSPKTELFWPIRRRFRPRIAPASFCLYQNLKGHTVTSGAVSKHIWNVPAWLQLCLELHLDAAFCIFLQRQEACGHMHISQLWDLGMLLMNKEDGMMPPEAWNAEQQVCSKTNVMYNILYKVSLV